MDDRTAATGVEALRAGLPPFAADVEADPLLSGAMLVSHRNEILLDLATGVASRRWGVPVTTATRFDVASVTKLFTAVAVLQQVAAGRLDLDASIHDHVDLAGTTISPEVTLRHVLTHSSGIADDADEEAGESYEALWVDRPSYSVTRTVDFLPGFVHKEPNFAPGEGCRYCNVGYVLAGLALEKVTGTTYRDYVREHVFARAGMTRSGFFDMREAEPDVAEGWDPVRADGDETEDRPVVGWKQNIYSYPPIGSPDGGAHTTTRDLATFLSALRSGRLLPPDLTAAALAPHVHHSTGATGTLTVGYGWEFVTAPDGTLRSMEKDGINAGSSAMLRHYPAADVTVVVLCNSEDGAWEPVRRLDSLVREAFSIA